MRIPGWRHLGNNLRADDKDRDYAWDRDELLISQVNKYEGIVREAI